MTGRAANRREWVLVTDGSGGQSRSTLAAVRGLALAGYQSAVTVSGRWSIAAASRYCSRTVPVPLTDDPGYADAVHAEMSKNGYLTVLPASDAAMQALGSPGGDFLDKFVLAAAADKVGLATPPGRRFADADALLSVADDLVYPVVVKPSVRTESRQRPARRFSSAGELRGAPSMPGPLIVQPAIDEGIHAVAGVMWHGKLLAAVHQKHVRIWPRDAGDACYAVTTPPVRDLEDRLEAMMPGYDGIFQAEFAGSYLLDVNPRVYGSLPLAMSAGANVVGIYCDLLRGVETEPVRGISGVVFRWWEGDLLHLASRWRAGELPREGRSHGGRRLGTHPLALKDPMPSIQRLRHVSHVLISRANGSNGGPSTAPAAKHLNEGAANSRVRLDGQIP